MYEAIASAIEKPLKGDVFERCAVELLREAYYPNLRPVEGGNDAGLDGVGELGNGEPFFLVSTVGKDARRNLVENIQSYLKAGGDRRVVVFATTRTVSGRRRAALTSQLREEFDVRLDDVHDRADFIQLLYHSSKWRKDLLGVPGQARALTVLPAKSRPMPPVPLIGRDDEIARLRDIEGDIVLVGKPGVGKTFLLQELMKDDWGLFDVGRPPADLEEAIRDLKPRRVVLDDAHLRDGKDDRLAVLQQLRREMDANFDVVAVSWPGQQKDVSLALPDSSPFQLPELGQDQILEVIEAVGVAEPRELQASLVEQAMGRAGLAATLAYACVHGRTGDVATGDALLTDIVGWSTRLVGEESRQVLGVLALSGKSGATRQQVEQVLGLDTPRVSNLIRGLASGGTIDETPSWEPDTPKVIVQPESLRYALVRDVFFGGAGSLEAAETIDQLCRPSGSLLALVGAVHRGAQIDRGLLIGLLNLEDSEQVTAYASLGPAEALEALERAPRHRALIAQAAYRSGINSKHMLRVLMELAVGNERAEHNTPDHPLRVIDDHIAASSQTIEERKLAVSVTDEWLRSGGNQDVAMRVLAHAIQPGIRRGHSDPGLGNTLTLSEGALPPCLIRELSTVWDVVLGLVEREHGASPAPIIGTLHYWVYPGWLAFGEGVNAESKAAIRAEASRVIGRLVEIWRDRPGALRHLRDYVSSVELDVQIEVPHDFGILFPADWDGSEDEGGDAGWEHRTDEAICSLAATMYELPTDEIATRVFEADAEAAAAGTTYPRLTPRLAQLLAEENKQPDLALAKLEQLGAAGDLMLPFLERVADLRPGGWEATLERLIENDRTSWIAVRVALTHPVGLPLKDAAIHRMTGEYRNLIADLILRKQIDQETVERLLDAPDMIVARDVAVSIWQARRKDLAGLSPTMLAQWKDVIVRSPADDYWYSVILTSDPTLLADWVRAQFFKIGDKSSYEFLPPILEEPLRELPATVRADLIRAVPADVFSIFIEEVVTQLVGDDTTIAMVLLGREELKELHWAALRDGPSEAWMERALAALERGWEPKRIVASMTGGTSSWEGKASLHWQSKIDAFANLRHDPPADESRETIIAAGIEFFTKKRDTAAAGEQQERVFGHNRR